MTAREKCKKCGRVLPITSMVVRIPSCEDKEVYLLCPYCAEDTTPEGCKSGLQPEREENDEEEV